MKKIFYEQFYIIDSSRNRITMSTEEFKKYLYSLDINVLNVTDLSQGDRAFFCEAPLLTFVRFKKYYSIFEIIKTKDLHRNKRYIKRGKHLR